VLCSYVTQRGTDIMEMEEEEEEEEVLPLI